MSARPNQREMCSASVTAAHTFSTGAAMSMVRRTVKVSASTTDAVLLLVVLMGVPLSGSTSSSPVGATPWLHVQSPMKQPPGLAVC